MSRDVKRMRRKLLKQMARINRAKSSGAGQGRKTVQGWVWTIKHDLYTAYLAADTPDTAGTDEVTPR